MTRRVPIWCSPDQHRVPRSLIVETEFEGIAAGIDESINAAGRADFVLARAARFKLITG